MPYVEELAAEKEGALKIVKVESKANRDLCVEHMVMTLPTFILFRGGKEVERIAGKSVEEDDISDLAAKA
jgi:thioredoxin 1